MLPLVNEAEVPLVAALPGAMIFRGFSASEELERVRRDGMTPRAPFSSTAEGMTLLRPDLPSDHVLEHARRIHFLSWSLSREVAIYYATSGGRHDGMLAVAQLPAGLERLKGLTGEPFALSGTLDGTEWIDPRHLTSVERRDERERTRERGLGRMAYNGERFPFAEWLRMRSRARVDQELLLVRGAVRDFKLFHMSRLTCDRRFRPWKETGELAVTSSRASAFVRIRV